MSNEPLPFTPTPTFWGMSPRFWWWLRVSVAGAASLALFVFAILWLQGTGNGNGDAQVIVTPSPDIQIRGEERSDFVTLKWDLIRVRKDLADLKVESDAWHKRFKELETSKTGARLIDDNWVVQHFVDLWGARLPREDFVQQYDDYVTVLYDDAVKTILDDAEKTVPVRESFSARVKQVSKDADDAKKMFNSHRRLLDALVFMVEKQHLPAKTLKDKIEALDAKIILTEFRHPSMIAPVDTSTGTDTSLVGQPDTAASDFDAAIDDVYKIVPVQDPLEGIGRTMTTREALEQPENSSSSYAPLTRPPEN